MNTRASICAAAALSLSVPYMLFCFLHIRSLVCVCTAFAEPLPTSSHESNSLNPEQTQQSSKTAHKSMPLEQLNTKSGRKEKRGKPGGCVLVIGQDEEEVYPENSHSTGENVQQLQPSKKLEISSVKKVSYVLDGSHQESLLFDCCCFKSELFRGEHSSHAPLTPSQTHTHTVAAGSPDRAEHVAPH